MEKSFNEQAQRVIAQAQHEARALGHDFVGTEHLLLALLHENAGGSVQALRALGATAESVRDEIGRIVHPGVAPATTQLPLTPRAQYALDCATQEAFFFQQEQVSAEHVMLGLFREPDGVAGRVLRNLGINLDNLRAEAFRPRLLQMASVERIVRPLHASMARKRKIREELLAHFEADYQEELANLGDPLKAVRAAAHRLGNPAALARDIQSSLSFGERLAYRFERLGAWCAPEPAAKWLARLALRYFLIMTPLWILAIIDNAARIGWNHNLLPLLCWVATFHAITPGMAFGVGLSYFKMRDSMFGVFGSRKSPGRALAYAVATGIIVFTSLGAFLLICSWSTASPPNIISCFAAILSSIIFPFILYRAVRQQGATQIADTHWACLNLEHHGLQFDD